jgi:hypothetical protein
LVAVRRPVAYEPVEAQQPLFTLTRSTDHRALVTNLALTPEAVYGCSCNRAFQDLVLREFKNASHMAHLPTRRCWANAAYLELVLWADDLVVAFHRLCLPDSLQHGHIATLRRELWGLPAEWIKRGNSHSLRLPATSPHDDLLLSIQQATAKVKPLIEPHLHMVSRLCSSRRILKNGT